MKVDGCIGGQGRRFASVIPRILQAGGSHENVAHCRPVDLLLANQASSTHVIVNDLQDIETVFYRFLSQYRLVTQWTRDCWKKDGWLTLERVGLRWYRHWCIRWSYKVCACYSANTLVMCVLSAQRLTLLLQNYRTVKIPFWLLGTTYPKKVWPRI